MTAGCGRHCSESGPTRRSSCSCDRAMPCGNLIQGQHRPVYGVGGTVDVAVGGDMGGDGSRPGVAEHLLDPLRCAAGALRVQRCGSRVKASADFPLSHLSAPSIARIGLRARQNRWQIGARAETSLSILPSKGETGETSETGATKMASGGKLARARWSGEAVAGSRNIQSTVILGLLAIRRRIICIKF